VSATLYRNAAAVYALTCGQELRAYALELAVPVGLLCDEKWVELTGAPRRRGSWIVLREKAVNLLWQGLPLGLDTSKLEKDRVFWILKSDPSYGRLLNQKSRPGASDPVELRLVPLLPVLPD
jgi:hypothetical protein